MNYTTSTSDQNLALKPKEADQSSSPAQPLRTTNSSAIPVRQRYEVATESSTNAMPNAILTNQGDMVRFEFTRALYERLVRIAMNPDGWRGPGTLSLRSSSIRSFIQFWSSIRDVAVEPEITLAPDGSLHAEWFMNLHQRLDIRFVDNKAIFGLFAGKSVLEGAERPEIVASILRTHPSNPLAWRAA